MDWLILGFEIAKSLFPAVVKLLKAEYDNGLDAAQALRDKPLEVSISFGGGAGRTETVLLDIESKLPEPAPEPTDPE